MRRKCSRKATKMIHSRLYCTLLFDDIIETSLSGRPPLFLSGKKFKAAAFGSGSPGCMFRSKLHGSQNGLSCAIRRDNAHMRYECENVIPEDEGPHVCMHNSIQFVPVGDVCQMAGNIHDSREK